MIDFAQVIGGFITMLLAGVLTSQVVYAILKEIWDSAPKGSDASLEDVIQTVCRVFDTWVLTLMRNWIATACSAFIFFFLWSFTDTSANSALGYASLAYFLSGFAFPKAMILLKGESSKDTSPSLAE